MDDPGTPITVQFDGRPFSGHYRRLSGNRLEVYTEHSSWVTFFGPGSVEQQARDLLWTIAHKESARGLHSSLPRPLD
jgi:hypothetical protein